MNPAQVYQQKIDVSWEFPVVFTHHLFDPSNRALRDAILRLKETRKHRVIVYVDSHVLKGNPSITDSILHYCSTHSDVVELAIDPQIIPGGEASKNDFRSVEGLIRQLLELRMDRQSFVIAIGGGAALDTIGFAAALVHRGLRLIRVPSTVLGQNDAGVGVKNAVNYLGKNAIGTFAPPFAVMNDFELLRTLPDRDWLCGVAEAFKVAIIRDAAFFSDLHRNAEKFPARDFEAMKDLVIRCATMHLDHIRTNGDPFEYGTARPLDFGHWSAHKIELLSNFSISHGEAVAAGVLLDSIYARHQKWISESELELIDSGLRRSGFKLWFKEYETRDVGGTRAVFGGLRDFQEHLGGELCVTFPKGIGARFEVHEIDINLMDTSLDELKNRAIGGT
jgi:3-dehydroquinate synthase